MHIRPCYCDVTQSLCISMNWCTWLYWSVVTDNLASNRLDLALNIVINYYCTYLVMFIIVDDCSAYVYTTRLRYMAMGARFFVREYARWHSNYEKWNWAIVESKEQAHVCECVRACLCLHLVSISFELASRVSSMHVLYRHPTICHRAITKMIPMVSCFHPIKSFVISHNICLCMTTAKQFINNSWTEF